MAVPKSVTPSTGKVGANLKVTVKGDRFTGTTDVSFGTGILVSGFVVIGDGELNVRLRISNNATPCPRTVVVTSPSGVGTLPNGFAVT